MTTVPQTFGSRLTYFRNAKGMTPFEFSDKYGIQPSHLKRIEHDMIPPSAQDLGDLMAADLNPAWLLSGSGPMLLSQCAPLQATDHEVLSMFRTLNAENQASFVELLKARQPAAGAV